jgi:hypothetical protein
MDGMSFEEFELVIQKVLGRDLPDAELRELYKSIDVDGSGTISTSEVWVYAIKLALKNRSDEAIAKAKISAAPSQIVNSSRRSWWQGGPEEFKFLIKAYEPGFYWFETVIYSKKLALAGVLSFASPGSTSQLYVALVMSFFFFAVLARTMPFKLAQTDKVAIVSEANLFMTILCMLMIKINLAGEIFTSEFYDSVIVTSNGIVAIIPLSIGTILGARKLITQTIDSRQAPPNRGDTVRILECSDIGLVNRKGSVANVSKNGTITVTILDVKKRAQSRWKSAFMAVATSLWASKKRKSGATKMPSEWAHQKNFIASICSRCCKSNDGNPVTDIEFHRSQVQVLFTRKHALKWVGGVLKLCTSPLKRLCCHQSGDKYKADTNDAQPSKENENESQLANTDTDDSVDAIDVEMQVHVDAELRVLATHKLRNVILHQLRPIVEPLLHKMHITWDDLQPAIAQVNNIDEMRNAIDDPHAFIDRLLASTGALAIKLAMTKLRPKLEPLLAAQSLTWEDALPALDLVRSLEQLQEALEEPAAFLAKLMASAGPVGLRLAMAKLRPKLEPLLAAQSLTWEDALPALDLVRSLTELHAAMANPETFVTTLMASVDSAVPNFAIAKLRPKLEPLLSKHSLTWEEVTPSLKLVKNLKELEVALEDPEAFLACLMAWSPAVNYISKSSPTSITL